ncbi:MAG: SIR2 family protein [Planctomycetota bacterium]
MATSLIDEGKYLDCAQIVADSIRPPDLEMILREQLEHPDFGKSEIHTIVSRLLPRVVVTTNFDELFESHMRSRRATAYNVCRYYDGHALNHIRSGGRVLLKAHGCMSDPERIILSRTQYFEAKRDFPSFFATLDALFLVNPVLFVGCGMDDPDMQLLLENVNLSAKSTYSHYAVVQSGRHPSIIRATQATLNVELLEYEQDHREVVQALNALEDKVSRFKAPSTSYFSETPADFDSSPGTRYARGEEPSH